MLLNATCAATARRNYAVAVRDARKGLVYALCCSTTTDAFDERKAAKNLETSFFIT